PLPPDFLVIATQNPREFEGTYPLPESQLDRFMLRIDMDYPAREAEAAILTRYGGVTSVPQALLGEITVLGRDLIGEARAEVERIHVADALAAYVLDLARASREHTRLTLGLSTRGALSLLKAARIAAGLRGGDFVTPDDVKDIAAPVMAHRLVLTPEAALEGVTDLDVARAAPAGHVPVRQRLSPSARRSLHACGARRLRDARAGAPRAHRRARHGAGSRDAATRAPRAAAVADAAGAGAGPAQARLVDSPA